MMSVPRFPRRLVMVPSAQLGDLQPDGMAVN
jgi:hypothetical protein